MDHLSASQINLYMGCSLKYRFQYVDQFPKPFKSSGLLFGSAIHSAISWFHKEQLAGRIPTVEKMCRIFEADWYSQKIESIIRYREDETENSQILLGRTILGLYYHQAPKEVKGAEIPFTVPLVNPVNGEHLSVNLEGYIDLLEEDDTIVEFKTSLRAMDLKDVNLQLTAYSYGFEMLHQRKSRKIKVVNFLKTKKPKILTLDVKQASIDHLRFFHMAKAVLNGIQSGVFFPNPSFWCNGCEYGGYCQVWGAA